MKSFTQILKETDETIRRLKADSESKAAAKSSGLDQVGKDAMDGKTRSRYSSSQSVKKGDDDYYGHLQYKRDHQTQKQSDVETKYVKTKTVSNGIERSTIDRKTHANVKDAAKHLNDLHKHYKAS